MASSNPSDDWVDVEDEEHLDVKELKSQIYDLKQKLTLSNARESTALKEKKDMQSELDHEKEKVTALEETNGKYKRELLLAKCDKRNNSLLEEEIEKSGKLRLELMQLKQTVKEKEGLEGMLDTMTKELDTAKNNDFLMKSAIQEALRYTSFSTSSNFNILSNSMRQIKDILNKCSEATKKE